MIRSRQLVCLASLLVGALGGCAAYTTPGRGADLSVVGVSPQTQRANTDTSIQVALDKKPLAVFPTGIAVARLQAPRYRSMTSESFGNGRYSIVTTRDIEKADTIERLSKLPMVHGIAPISRLLVSPKLDTDRPLREAAAQLHADMLLIYTLDTTFQKEDNAVPLTVVTLGLAPTKNVRVVSTASAALLDTRSGYVYGVAEATARDKAGTNAWQSDETADKTRRETEEQAFEKLVGELEQTWRGVVTRYAASPTTMPVMR